MSTRIPQAFLNELLARIDIVEIIDSRVTLKKAGSNYSACCPFHTEKSPSFTVSPTKQFYYCFGCGAHGNAIGFLMAFDRMEFIDAVETLAQQAGVEIPYEQSHDNQQQHTDAYAILEKITQYYRAQLQHSPAAIAYLKSRQVTGEIAKRFELGFAPAGWDNLTQHLAQTPKLQEQLLSTGMLVKNSRGNYYDRFRERIMFPIRDIRGRVIAFGGRTLGNDTPKYLNSPETPLFHKGSELYGLYEAKQATANLSAILIVEGYMDVIALAQHGITNVVATLGTATSSKHLQRLFRSTSELIFCFDGDRAGQQAAWRALTVSLPVMRDGIEIRFMFLPQEDDPDSLIRKEGENRFRERVANAQPLSEFFFAHLIEQTDITSLDGKAKLAKLAKDLLEKLPDSVFKQLMLKRLTSIIGTDIQHIPSNNPQHKPNTSKSLPSSVIKKRTPVRLAITLLLQHPSLARFLINPDELATIDLPGISLLINLCKLLHTRIDLSTGAILEYWRDSKESKQLARLATWELMIPEDGLQDEFLAAIERIKTFGRERLIQHLLAKANQQQLSAEEKQRLLQLLAERQDRQLN